MSGNFIYYIYISLEDFCGFDFEYLNIISGDDSSFKATRRGSGLNVSGGSPDPDELKKGVVSIGVKKVKDMVDSIPSGGGKDDSVDSLCDLDDRERAYGPGNSTALDDGVQHFNNIVDINIRGIEKIKVDRFGDEN